MTKPQQALLMDAIAGAMKGVPREIIDRQRRFSQIPLSLGERGQG